MFETHNECLRWFNRYGLALTTDEMAAVTVPSAVGPDPEEEAEG